MNSSELWSEFLTFSGLPDSTEYVDSFHFELSEYWANELLRLVLAGVKKATSSSMYNYEINGDPLPQVGDYNIVTDWAGNARCIIRTTRVTILPYKDVTFDLCRLEGEDDSLESWRNAHSAFFEQDGSEIGFDFSEDMQVVFEEFEVVYAPDAV